MATITGDITVPPGNMAAGLPYSWNPSIFNGAAANFPPGSPEWWLFNGMLAIEGKQTYHTIRENYVSGNHPLPNGDRRYVKALRDFQEKALTNYVALATNAMIPRMRVKGFRFGRPEAPKPSPTPSTPQGDNSPQNGSQGPQKADSRGNRGIADRDARLVWMSNDMDSQMDTFLTHCATYGEGYLLVGPEDPETEEPTITVEHPKLCHVFSDPVRPTRSLAGVRVWKDIYLGKMVAVVYLDDGRVIAYTGPANGETVAASVAFANGSFKQLSVQQNSINEVPLVRCQWRPDGKAEAEDAFEVQDRINLTILNRLVISKSQAYRQRWMTGGQIAQAKKGKKGVDAKPPFDPGADTLWHVPAPDAKFGDFDQVDITQILNSVRDDVLDFAGITQLPAHYLMGRMANISGDTLTQAESGHKLRTQARQRSVGWAIEKAMRLVFKYKGDMAKAKELDAEVIWGDAEIRSLAEKADAAVKFAQAFASAPPFMVPILAELMDLEPDQVESLVVAAEEYQAQQQAREDQMMQQQADNAVALAKEGAKAKANGGGASKPAQGAKK